MKIIKPSFEILSFPENIELLETAGRNCYQSEPKGNPESFVKKIVDSGHESVIEHLSATVRIICDRGVLAEITRHRLASFSVESSRYCNYYKDKFSSALTVIKPSFWQGDSEEDILCYEAWDNAMTYAELFYMKLIKLGATPEQARSVLPMSLKTEIIMSANLREWLHIFKLRCSEKSHPDMRFLMRQIRGDFAKRLPVIFG